MPKITSLKINNVDYELSGGVFEITDTTTIQEVYDAAMNGCTTLIHGDSSIGYFTIDTVQIHNTKPSITLTTSASTFGFHSITIIDQDPNMPIITAINEKALCVGFLANRYYNYTHFSYSTTGFGGIIEGLSDSDFVPFRTGEPEHDQDATTKLYVDTQIASVKPSVQKIENLIIEPGKQYGWINRSSDILVDLYIGEDVVGYPEMYGSIKIPIAQGTADYVEDYISGSHYYFNITDKDGDPYTPGTLLSEYGYDDRPYNILFLASQPISECVGFFLWRDGETNIPDIGLGGLHFSPPGAVYNDETYLTLVPKLIRL